MLQGHVPLCPAVPGPQRGASLGRPSFPCSLQAAGRLGLCPRPGCSPWAPRPCEG